MKKIALSIFLAGTLCFCLYSQTPANEVKLTINVSDVKASGLSVAYSGQLYLVDNSYRQYPIRPNEAGNCEITFPLETGQYFMISRNPLYLTPGDRLTIRLNTDPNLSRFEGTGSEINTYLKKRYYAKGGSFLASGNPAVMRPTLEEQIAVLDSLAAARRKELSALKIDSQLKKMEDIRIKADYVNSLVYYPTYRGSAFFGEKEGVKDIKKEVYYARMSEYLTQIKPYVLPLLEEMASDDKYLDIEVVRLVLGRFSNEMFSKGYDLKLSERFQELSEIAAKSSRIRGSMSKKEYDELAAFGETIRLADDKYVYMSKLERHTKFVERKPAIDFEVTDPEGNRKKLSDYKGKIMYVDVWATWCMPCRMQAPFFKELSEKYENIRFISLSVDEEKPAWDKFIKNKAHGKLIELWAEPAMRKKWDISGIPRFLLIDENFNIINAAAPRPSETDEIRPLLEKYNQL